MNILKKRPLCLILCVMLGGFSFFINSDTVLKLSLIISSLLAFSASFIFKNLLKGRVGLIRVCLIAFAVSVALSSLWNLSFYPRTTEEVPAEITGTICEIDNSGSTTSKITLKTKNIDGRKASHRIYVYIDKSLATEVQRYDVITFTSTLNPLNKRDNTTYNNYYVADGISATAYDVTDLEILENKFNYADYYLKSIKLKICNTLKMRTDFETGAFLSALIMGDRSDLDGNTILNFKRIGISHILALSGMHLAILAGIITKLLTLFGIAKKKRVALISVFVIIYMFLTGLSVSVVRAGIMLIVAGVLYLLSSKSDNITSLAISVSIIVILSPHSVFDISLWLSAFATLGVIVFAEIQKSRPNQRKDLSRTRRFALWIFDAILVSVFATGATLAITALNFNAFSLLFAPATIIFGFLAEALIIAGCLVLAIGWLVPIGKPVIWLSDITKELAEMMSNFEMAQISISSVLAKALVIVFTIAFFLFLICEFKKRKLAVILLVALLSITVTTATVETAASRFDDALSYSPSNSGDVFLMKSNGNISLVYSGNARTDDSFEIINYLLHEKINYVDSFILANYSYTTVEFCKSVGNSIKLERILVPTPQSEEEVNQAEGLADSLSLYGTYMVFYDTNQALKFGEFEYVLYNRNFYQYGDYPSNVFKISDSQGEYVYLSSCDYDLLNFKAKAVLYQSRNVYLGSIKNSKYYPFNLVLPEVESINITDASRLDDNTMNYYKEKGASINLIKTPVDIWD